MHRLLFEKTGNAIWISHLDLMRLFQRAFKRAGFSLTHTQGYSPKPSVSIAMPLSVGVESVCELLDFDLEGDTVSDDEIVARLNQGLVEGVRVLRAYENGQKIKNLSLLHCQVCLEYDSGIPETADSLLQELFSRQSLIVPKKSKNGIQEQDIIPMIKRLDLIRAGEQDLVLDCVVCCQNPTLNPMQIAAAIELHLPAMKPDFVKCRRIEIFDVNENVFR
jgi:radical SAM-linked protein